MQGNTAAISQIFPQVPKLQGPVQAKGKVQGVKDTYRIDGFLQSDGVSVNNKPSFSLKAEYKVDTTDKAAPYHANVRWSSIPLSLAGDFLKNSPEINSLASGQLYYAGPQDFWKGSGTFAVDLEQGASRGIPVNGRILGDLAEGAVRVDSGSLNVDGTSVTFKGNVGQDSVSAEVGASMQNLRTLSTFVPELRKVPGSYKVNANINGPFENLKVAWDLTGSATEMKLTSTGTYFTGTKQIDAHADGETTAALLNRFYRAELQGNILFEGKATGTLNRPVVHATIQGESLIAKGTEIGKATIEAVSDGQILTASVLLPDFSTTAQATYRIDNRSFELNTQTNNLTADQLKPLLGQAGTDVSGFITATLNASGNIDNWRRSNAHLHVQEADFNKDGFHAAISVADIEVLREVATVDVKASVMDGTLNIQGTAGLSNKGVLNLHVFGDNDLRALSQIYPEVEAEGKVTMDVQVRGTVNKPLYSGLLSSDSFSAEMPQRKLKASDGKLRAEFSNTVANVQTSLTLNGSPIQAQGQVPLTPSGALDVRVQGDSNLELLSSMTQTVEGSGAIHFDVTARGTINAPDLSGSVKSEDFSLSYPSQNIALTKASAEAQFSGEMIRLQTSGLLNGAQLSVNGTVPLKDSDGAMQLTLQSFPVKELAAKADVNGTVSVKMDARGRGTKPTNWTADLYITPENLKIQETEKASRSRFTCVLPMDL